MNLRSPLASVASTSSTSGAQGAVIPEDDRSAAVSAFGDHAFELVVFDGMVFGLHREAFVRWIERRTFGNCPRKHHAVVLQAKVVVQPAGRGASGRRIRDLFSARAALPAGAGVTSKRRL
jgi:hypothetical protein